MTIAFRLRMGSAVMAAAIALLCSLIYVEFETSQDVIRSARAISEFLGDTQNLLTGLVDAETGQRGFIITGEDRYLEPYQAAVQAIPGRMTKLRAVADGPVPRNRIDRLETLVSAKLDELAKTIRVRRAEGREAATRVVLADRGRTLMVGIRLVVAEMGCDDESRIARTR